ncbi:DUF2795 domain-containing protein [Streptomyces sp. TP-A0874]|uniref:DUF2795 domain-containing protein n=1 Tax=Streptomyces sp. TP-A0874 TaxID=549819 RepID=UPI000853D976|nr:DUF2795 domain-containing protein [Streptomyces sp. TP-A0874]
MASDKTGPLHDEEMKAEMQGELKADRATRAEEERDMEPSGEDQPEVSRAPDEALHGGTPPGMSQDDVEVRSDLARHLGLAAFPGDRVVVLDTLRENNAPDRLIDMASGLPEGREFQNVQDVVRALGLGVEDRRT